MYLGLLAGSPTVNTTFEIIGSVDFAGQVWFETKKKGIGQFDRAEGRG